MTSLMLATERFEMIELPARDKEALWEGLPSAERGTGLSSVERWMERWTEGWAKGWAEGWAEGRTDRREGEL